MITTNTVFVLGAGASVPYGFPTGAKLREMICQESQSGGPLHASLIDCGYSGVEIEQFRSGFLQSGINSIDRFIALRPEFQTIGVQAIAAVLLPLERDEKLTTSDWYQMIWNSMLAGINSAKELSSNRIRFVSFNYDRSLEQYFLNAIINSFGLDRHAAFDVLSEIPVQHVYGTLGAYSVDRGYRYGGYHQNVLPDMVRAAHASVKTVPSMRGSRDEIAARWLAHAEQVFIMGFGFEPTNCARIDLHAACTVPVRNVTPPNIFSSAFHLTQAEMRLCELNSRNPGAGGLHWTTGDCLTLLRERIDQLN